MGILNPRLTAAEFQIRLNAVAGVTLGSVTSYISAIVGAEQRFRPKQHIGSAYVAGVTLGSVTSYISHSDLLHWRIQLNEAI